MPPTAPHYVEQCIAYRVIIGGVVYTMSMLRYRVHLMMSARELVRVSQLSARYHY